MDFQRFLNAFLVVFRTALTWHIPFIWGDFSMDFYPFYWVSAIALIKKGFDLFFPLNSGDDEY